METRSGESKNKSTELHIVIVQWHWTERGKTFWIVLKILWHLSVIDKYDVDMTRSTISRCLVRMNMVNIENNHGIHLVQVMHALEKVVCYYR